MKFAKVSAVQVAEPTGDGQRQVREVVTVDPAAGIARRRDRRTVPLKPLRLVFRLPELPGALLKASGRALRSWG